MAPENCPNCGYDLPPNAKVCPECGSDEQTGWSEEAYVGSLDLPDESFDYDAFAEREFGSKKARNIKPRGVSWIWWVVAVALLFPLIYAFLVWVIQ